MNQRGRLRATVGWVLGFAAWGTGVGLRALEAVGTAEPFVHGASVWAFLGLSFAAAVGAWLARPQVDAVWELGFLPVVILAGVAATVMAAVDPASADVMLPAGLELVGGSALVMSVLRFFRAQARLEVREVVVPTPKKVRRAQTEKKTEILLSELKTGDVIEISAGDNLPCDGIVTEGTGFVEEAVLMGPVLPVAKEPGDTVFAGTQVSSGDFEIEVKALGERSLLAQRERRVAAVAAALQNAPARARVLAFVLALVVFAAGAEFYFLHLQNATPLQLGLAMASIALAVPLGAPLVAHVRARLAALGWARAHGLIISRAQDVESLARARRFAVDPLLLAAPGAVEAVAFSDVPPETLLMVAESLQGPRPGPELESLQFELRNKELLRADGAALSYDDGVARGTVNGQRWFMGAPAALEDAGLGQLDASQSSPVDFLRDRGMVTFVVGREGEGPLGAVGIGFAAHEDAQTAAKALKASLLPGLSDATRAAVAKAAQIDADGPPLSKRDVSLLAPKTERPSRGVRVRVLAAETTRLPKEGAPRMIRTALPKVAVGLNGLPARIEAAGQRAFAVLVVLPLVVAALVLVGALVPAVSAIVAVAAIAYAGRSYSND